MVKVINWIDYDNYNFDTADATEEEINAVVLDIKTNGYKFGGDDHENHSCCCPLLSNGKALRMSWRGWGHIMALAYDLKTEDGKPNYILWYMGEYGPEKRMFPKSSGLNKEDIPFGKEFIYELSEKESKVLKNDSFNKLVLPKGYFEQVNLKAFDRVIFKFNNEIVLKGFVNEVKFIRCTLDELFKEEKLETSFPGFENLNTSIAANSNFEVFSKQESKEFIKNKYDIEDDNLVVICLEAEF